MTYLIYGLYIKVKEPHLEKNRGPDHSPKIQISSALGTTETVLKTRSHQGWVSDLRGETLGDPRSRRCFFVPEVGLIETVPP